MNDGRGPAGLDTGRSIHLYRHGSRLLFDKPFGCERIERAGGASGQQFSASIAGALQMQ
jgi:hypothetical protein